MSAKQNRPATKATGGSVKDIVAAEARRLALKAGSGPTSEQRQQILAAVKKARPDLKDDSIKSQTSQALKGLGHAARHRKVLATAESNGVPNARAAFFALRAGSVEKAKAQLDKVESNAAMEFAISCGGIDAARKALDELAKRL